MKVAMIGHKRIPSREGGVEIVVEKLAVGMVKRGHQVTAYNRRGKRLYEKDLSIQAKEQKEYKGVRIVSVPTIDKKSLNAIIYSVAATIKALFGHYDIIHFHAEGPCCMIWLPAILHIRTVATIHGLDWQRAKWGGFATKFLLFSEKMAVKFADQVIVLSENNVKYFKDTYDRKVLFVPNGVEKPEVIESVVIREKWRLVKDGYILFLARLVPEKGLEYLLDAYKQLNTDKKLVIAGGGSHSSEYVEQIKTQISGNNDIILTGFVQGEVLQELYSNAYIYVLPSDIEGMPLSLLEAMSYGNCCVVSDIAENVEVVEDKAYCFKKGSADSLKCVLQHLLENEELVRAKKETASTYICEKYDWNRIVDRTLEIYESINGK